MNNSIKTDRIVTFNKLGFLSSVLIDLIDQLEGTKVYNKQLKYHLNRARIEAEKVANIHFKPFNKGESLKQRDDTFINSQDVHCITSKAYDFLFEKEPSKIVVIADVVKKAEEQNTIDYDNASIPFDKLEN